MSKLGYKIAIGGISGKLNINDDSLVNLNDINVTNPMNDDKFVVIDIKGWESDQVQSEESAKRVGGIYKHQAPQTVEHTIKLRTYEYPSEYYIIRKLQNIFRKENVLLYKGDYEYITDEPDKSYIPHPDGTAIAVAGGITVTYEYDGFVEVEISLKNVVNLPIDRK